MSHYEAYLLQLPRYGDQGKRAMHPGLERIDALLDAMGRPHRQFASIHVAGTNGKGSTASMLTAILSAAGRSRVGLYTSPHLISMRERIRCDGAAVPDAWMQAAVTRHRDLMEVVQPSFFEAMTALAFLYFAEKNVSVAVVEAGLGGRLDATNTLVPRLSIITGIDYDHTNILGQTLGAIAREKGGIIKPGIPVLTAAHQPEALNEILTIAERAGSPAHVIQRSCRVESARGTRGPALSLVTPEARYSNLTLELAGRPQTLNALLAVRATELLYGHHPAAVQKGLGNVRALSGLRGRLEVLGNSPLVILDVAHNVAGLECALSYARGHCVGRLFVLFGLVRSKDMAGMARILFASRAIVYACDVPARRGLEAQVLADALRSWQVPVAGAGPVESAIAHVLGRAGPEDTVLVCGSHYLAGAFLAAYA